MNRPGAALDRPPPDTHAAQALRVARYCEINPGRDYTAAELGAACDLGSPTKVPSAMDGPLGYGMVKDWRTTLCDGGRHSRRVRVYRCISRPARPQLDLEFPFL